VAEIVLDVDAFNSAGDGVARHRGRVVTIPFTIPGERVRVAIDAQRHATASLLEVLRPSPHRVQARCMHFGVCGGCSWQHIAYSEQLRLKTEIVDRLVRQTVPKAPAAHPMIAATPLDDPWHFRQKVHFVFDRTAPARNGRSLSMGHYARGSRRVMPVRECPVHDQRGNAVAFGLYDAYAGIAGRQGLPTLKSVAIRVSNFTDETMATLVVTENTDRRVRAATRKALETPWAPTSFHINVHPRGDAFIFGPETRRITGTERLRDEVAGVTFLTSPTAFFQTNVRAAEALVHLVLDAVPSGAAVLDLYAGGGLFALPLATRGHRVIAVEASRTAVGDGEASLRLNRIPPERCRFVATPVSAFIRRPALADWLRLCDASRGSESPRPSESLRAAPGNVEGQRGERGLVVVLDPPREGCEAVVLDDVFGRIGPAAAIYVSCNPETLARDLTRCARHGYTIESMQPVDMFPHTPHIETVVRITRLSRTP
jgi:23S rRNA (uracil1939-C5)-methyltransferase